MDDMTENSNLPIGFTPSMIRDMEELYASDYPKDDKRITNEVKNLVAKGKLEQAIEKRGTFPL